MRKSNDHTADYEHEGKCKVIAHHERGSQTSHHSLHGSLVGPGFLDPAAHKYAHGEEEHQETHCRSNGHHPHLAITGLVPGGILCGKKQ